MLASSSQTGKGGAGGRGWAEREGDGGKGRGGCKAGRVSPPGQSPPLPPPRLPNSGIGGGAGWAVEADQTADGARPSEKKGRGAAVSMEPLARLIGLTHLLLSAGAMATAGRCVVSRLPVH